MALMMLHSLSVTRGHLAFFKEGILHTQSLNIAYVDEL